MARAIEEDTHLRLIRDIIPVANTVVCRLTASIEMMKRRVQMRDFGISQRKYIARVAILNDILDRARLEDIVVANENRSLTDVALEMLVKAGWI